MPLIPFEELPDDARLWVFGAFTPLDEVDAPRLLRAVDGFLESWKTHGTPLTCGREFRDEFFLTVAVDERGAGASGCSVDGLFRVLQKIEDGIGSSMVAGGRVYFRAPGGLVATCSQGEFESMARRGDVTGETRVFDLTVTTAADYRARFERGARESWHAQLLPTQARR